MRGAFFVQNASALRVVIDLGSRLAFLGRDLDNRELSLPQITDVVCIEVYGLAEPLSVSLWLSPPISMKAGHTEALMSL
jgi:hypothetical protein